MTDKERLVVLNTAIRELKLTEVGYPKKLVPNTHWSRAMKSLNHLAKDLAPPDIPALGPVYTGGRSVLAHDLTHATTGIPLYPAFDDAYAQGRIIIAPEPLEVIAPETSANPGEAFYAKGDSKIRYWFGHLDRAHAVGTKFSKGAAVGRVAVNNIGGGPHIHVGINVELLIGKGKELIHHDNYTHGAPTVGVQLAKLL